MTYLVEILPAHVEDSHISFETIIYLLEADEADLS